MKNTNDLIIKNYIKKVTKFVPNTYRARLKKELQNSLFESFHDSSALTETMLHERFGTPEHFATEYLSAMDAEELHAHMTRSKRHIRILIIVLVFILILLIPITVWICSEGKRHRESHYYIDETFDYGS